MRLVTKDDHPPQGRRSRLLATPGGPPGARNRGVGAWAAFWTSARVVVRRIDGGCRAVWDALPPNALDLLWPQLLAPSPRHALQAVPVSRLPCGLDSPQFPPRGGRADVFRPSEVLLTIPGLPDYAARQSPSRQLLSRQLLSPQGSWRSWTSWLRRWFRR